MKFDIRKVYLYLFAFIGLLITTIGTVRLVQTGLETYVFTEANTYVYYPAPKLEGESTLSEEELEERQERENRAHTQRELAGALSMILVGFPLYLYHWRTIQKEYSK